MKLPLRRTCREAALLMSTRNDRELPWTERLALRLHLAACDACPAFDRQMRLMDEAMGRWRAYVQRDE
ncbi:MAG TPA: zf-HC2 domain-containing protein [Methylibium sp.]|uniref:zf-HC2 domain-containing protein n=1 Tax=Methylibium sp. TaxID=2067992 RepID=UPI002DBB1977|nr:zf-HC2 domain-containing protein [Methylibium sp.]HEU4457519.1 zf-HC2 domain-containing protein [Methylibium sp.]